MKPPGWVLFEQRADALGVLRERPITLRGQVLADLAEAQERPAKPTPPRAAEPRGGRIDFGPDGTPAGRSERWRWWRGGPSARCGWRLRGGAVPRVPAVPHGADDAPRALDGAESGRVVRRMV